MNYKIVLYGVPIKSSRGFIGWSTVSVISRKDQTILFDTGSYGSRGILLNRLVEIGVNVEDINIVFLSHLHYDHSVNVELFKRADICVSKKELEYFFSGRYISVGDNLIPTQIINSVRGKIRAVEDGEEIAEGVKVVELPGHTPGTAGLLVDNVIFAGDAVKNAWEFIWKKEPSPVFSDPQEAIANYDVVKNLASIVVPGHDTPFKITSKGVEYLEEQHVDICSYRDPLKSSFSKIKI